MDLGHWEKWEEGCKQEGGIGSKPKNNNYHLTFCIPNVELILDCSQYKRKGAGHHGLPRRLQIDYSDLDLWGCGVLLVAVILRDLCKLDSLYRTHRLFKRLPSDLHFPGRAGPPQTGPFLVNNEFGI